MNLVDITPRETAVESGGYVKGVAVAIVTQNKDPDGLCRVKVSYPWHDQPRESYWARLATPMAGQARGLVLIPEVDDEVLVAFERGDLRFPFVLGSLWNGPDGPPLANDDGKNDRRVLETRKHHKLFFNDGSPGVVELAHVDGRRVVLDDNGVLVEDGAGNKFQLESNSGAMTLQANGPCSIKAKTIAIEADATAEVKAGAALTLRGSVVNVN